jgi:hypothetical protein
VSFDGATLLRIRDVASLYGTVFGSMQMRTTGLWFIWDLAQLHDEIRRRIREQRQELTYSPRSDGRAISVADTTERGTGTNL